MKKIIPILIAILICFGVGCTASYFQSEAILNWYPTLDKPSLTPPDMAFPIAWSLIYLCMGISIGLIWHMCKHSNKCTFYTLRFGCSFAVSNTIKPQLL